MSTLSKISVAAFSVLASLPLVSREQPSREVADDRFNVMTHFAHGWDPAIAPTVARSGVAGVRDELYWREVEPQPGVFIFSDHHERTMTALANNKLSPFIVLSFENDHYDGGATPHTDEAIAAYARYGGEVVRRYGEIKAVEVWNEYNGTFVRGPAEGDRAGNYLRLLRATFAEVKRVQPGVLVVGGATAGVPLPYWEKLLAGGALGYMDALSVHPYRYDAPPEGIETDIAELAALVARYNDGKPKPIWVTEIGWQEQAAVAPGDLAIDPIVQAQFLVRGYALLLSAEVQRVYWYLFRDYNEYRMGLVRDDPPMTEKPAFTAMATMTQQLRGARFMARDKTPREIYSLRFRRPSGEDVRVMWSLQPREVRASGVKTITDMLGRALPFTGKLSLGESPIFVTGALKGLPGSTETVIADSRLGFSGAQGQNGWSYGYSANASDGFTPLPTYGVNDWRAAWHSHHPYLWVSSTDQHPSHQDGGPVASIRRWQSDRERTVRIAGSFRGGKYGGDGLGIAILVNGEARLRNQLGAGNAVSAQFDFTERVQAGTTIDFIVDPGPAANIDHDGTAVAVTISTPQ